MRSHALCRFFTIFVVFLVSGCGSADHRLLEEVVEKMYSLEPEGNVTIQNRDGAVLVYGSHGGDIRVQCVKKAYSHERLDQIAIDVSTKPAAISVAAKFPPRPKWAFSDHSGTVDCTIVLPATANISTLDLDAGEVVLDGMHGREIHARLRDGRIFVRNCFTNLDVTLHRGTLTLGYDWWEPEKFSAQVDVGRGNAWVFLPTNSTFHLLAAVAYGTISNDFNDVPLTKPSAKGMKVDEIVNGRGSATIQIRVDKGNIKIAEANP